MRITRTEAAERIESAPALGYEPVMDPYKSAAARTRDANEAAAKAKADAAAEARRNRIASKSTGLPPKGRSALGCVISTIY